MVERTGPADADAPHVGAADEARHDGAAVEEWLFAAWSEAGDLGVLSGHRLLGRRAWYWAALARAGRPLLHVAEWDVVVRADPMIVKAEALWAEHTCDAPMEQWSIGNETYAVALDDPAAGLGRAYGAPTAIAFDLEWYSAEPPRPIAAGYEQPGRLIGAIDVAGEPRLDLDELAAHRWHRWGASLAPLTLLPAVAHTRVRAPFAFPDGSVSDLVITPAGWRSRGRPPGSPGRAANGAPAAGAAG
jgi:hypothetical protein